jgi:queuine tRNA-ribosyltransferase
MVIDDMAPPDASKEQFMKALGKTHNWAKQCKEIHDLEKTKSLNPSQQLFAIVQGGYDAELRKQSAEYLSSLDFDGYGIGGCAIGEPKPDMYRAIKNSVPFLPEDKPRYLMGVGSPEDIVLAVSFGVDCFDSIFPTRNARHDTIFTFKGTYQVDKAVYAKDNRPLEEGCDCWVCQKHSRAYIRHLASIDEAEGMRLRQVHNLRFMMRLMGKLRKHINQGTLASFREEFLHDWFKGKIPKLYRELLDELE